jgi:hypothetical protein
MSFRGKRELLVQVAPRYSSARCWRRDFLTIVRQCSAMTMWHVDDAGCGTGSEWVAERSDRQG